MTAIARLEATSPGPRTIVAYFPTEVAPELVERLRPVVDKAIADAVGALGVTAADARLLLAVEVAQLAADGEAYEREAARRGVLAL